MQGMSVLTLDGGGLRGAFGAAFLARLEERAGTRIADHFDLIVGTSTGGIIAIGLGLGFSPREILDFYLANGDRIFPSMLPRWLRKLPGGKLLEPTNHRAWWRRKYSNEPLAQALRDVLGAGRSLGSSRKRLVITSYDLQRSRIKLFKTAHDPRFGNDWRIPAWKVALATSAAPTYLPAAKANDRTFVDGGLWANDPVLVGVIEAIRYLNSPPTGTRVLSIGTLEEVRPFFRTLASGGKLFWAKHAPIEMMTGQSFAAQGQAKLLIGARNLVRISPAVAAGRYEMDDPSRVDELMGLAASEAEDRAPEIETLFLGHRAPEFVPYYGEASNGPDYRQRAA